MCNNLLDCYNEDDIGIHPGSHGSLHFWIVPKEQQTIKINYNLKITPYKKHYPNTTDGKTDYDAEPSPVALGDSDNTLAAYVDSHILFFRPCLKKQDSCAISTKS